MYLEDKKVRVKNEMVPDGNPLLTVAGDNSDEEVQSVANNDNNKPHVRQTGNDNDNNEDGK